MKKILNFEDFLQESSMQYNNPNGPGVKQGYFPGDRTDKSPINPYGQTIAGGQGGSIGAEFDTSGGPTASGPGKINFKEKPIIGKSDKKRKKAIEIIKRLYQLKK
jgi:hypothetical protein